MRALDVTFPRPPMAYAWSTRALVWSMALWFAGAQREEVARPSVGIRIGAEDSLPDHDCASTTLLQVTTNFMKSTRPGQVNLSTSPSEVDAVPADVHRVKVSWSHFALVTVLTLGLVIIVFWISLRMADFQAKPLTGNVPSWSLIAVRVATSTASVAEGYVFGCISGVALLVEDELKLTKMQIAVFVGCVHFMMAVGSPLGGWLADRYGRVPIIMASNVMMIIGALMMALATSYHMLIAGRIVEAFFVGAGMSVVSTYSIEVSPTAHRGMYPSLEELFLCTGSLLGYAANSVFFTMPAGWRWIVGLAVAPPVFVVMLLAANVVPESPRFLLLKNRWAEAETVLVQLVGAHEAQEAMNKWVDETPMAPSTRSHHGRAMMVSVGVMTFQMMSGLTVLVSYGASIFSEYMSEHTAVNVTLFVGILRVSVVVPILFMIDIIGRRPLLLMSAAGLTLATTVLAIGSKSGIPVLVYLGQLLFLVAYSIGVGPCAWVLVSEVLDSSIRSAGVSLAITCARLYAGIQLVSFPAIHACLGDEFVFLVLAASNLCGLLFVYTYVPETRGMLLEDIHTCFEK
mmetsp:Transcript_106897/g.300565  ORF Transcript_106897/g.300565 Transcript_106897/m.300565 type:complete len:571 (-) Transcript_106897:104-1816(-)